MNTLNLKELQDLLAKEYARFVMLVQYQECGLTEDSCGEECEESDCETDDCCGTCDDECEAEEETEEEVDGADFDPYEYALLFCALRITVYLQHIIQSGFEASNPNKKDATFEEVIRWLLSSGVVKKEDDLNEFAVLFAFFDETVQLYPSEDVMCYTQDIDRLPSLPLEQIVSAVEIGMSVSQVLAKNK